MTHTHCMITSKTLRSAYALELWQARILRSGFTANEFKSIRYGMESGIWAVQKALYTDILK
jgi:hypothetical protein